ncbi:phosphoglycerate mutase-like protein [Thozetella sp. PMI_491]|nr:phosphoglycerate mutase-like protein [Thozetella sp. PMI_491]
MAGKPSIRDYEPVGQIEDGPDAGSTPMRQPASGPKRTPNLFVVAVGAIGLGLPLVAAGLFFWTSERLAHQKAIGDCPCLPSDVPQYFQTSPELWAGPTPTGKQPFLAQTRTFNPTATYVPNAPLQTSIPIEGMGSGNQSIFEMMGYLSPYTPSPGFGVNEYPLPAGAEIIQLQMLSRHGSRYPTGGSNVEDFGRKIAAAGGTFQAKGALSFLNDWKYQLGAEILVPKGRQELYDSGVLHSYMYSQLYNPNSKIIARTTTQDRMLKSAENFMAGFFGLEWTNNVTIEVIIEEANFNNSLAGYLNCPNGEKSTAGTKAATVWARKYLQKATERLNSMVDGFEFSLADTSAAQTMCPYETVAYGFSRFCDLFTYEEWVGFGYMVDLNFYGNDAFGSPVGVSAMHKRSAQTNVLTNNHVKRAVGIGWQQEMMARLKNHTLGYSGSQINITLDNNTDTFPLNQSIYFDFSHDTNIVSILAAFGLKQFAEPLPADNHPGPHNFTVSHLTPFGARLDIEVVRAPKPVAADRAGSGYLPTGRETKYIHFVLNQRTVPLGYSFPECDASRLDGWCELDTFLKIQDKMPQLAQYEHSCFGEYPELEYGQITDGVPI